MQNYVEIHTRIKPKTTMVEGELIFFSGRFFYAQRLFLIIGVSVAMY